MNTNVAELTPRVLNSRQAIKALESVLLALPEEQQIVFETMHGFVPGVYSRTLFLTADSLNTSLIHLVQNFFTLASGHITMLDTAGFRHELRPPFLAVTMPGTMRAVYAHEDSIITTFHPNPDDCRDIATLEARYFSREFPGAGT